jgi:hypothetical protein
MFAGATKGEGTPAVKKILRNPAAIALIFKDTLAMVSFSLRQ